MRVKIFLKKIFCILFSVTFASISTLSAPVYAKIDIPSGRTNEFAENNIIFYDPNGSLNGDCPPSQSAIDSKDVLVIGDSITNGSQNEIKTKLPDAEVIAQDSKHFSYDVSGNESGLTILKNKNKDEIRKTVIFALGTNDQGGVSSSDIDKVLDIIGSERTLVLVTNHKLNNPNTYQTNNNTFKSAANSHSNIIIADWDDAVKDDDDKYITNADGLGVHPTSEGREKFADVISSALKGGSTGSSGGIISGNNQLYDGSPAFSEESLQAIESNRPFYEKAASKYDMSWQIIAVLHYREAGLKRYNPANGQGAYQLYSYTGGGSNGNAFLPAGEISDNEFQRQTDIMAKLIRENYGNGLDLNNNNDIKALFFRYNGTAPAYISQARSLGFSEEEANRGEGSPYVMNKADEKRDPNKNPNGWGQIKSDGGGMVYPANLDPGAFVLFSALGGGTGVSCRDSGKGNGDINKTALELAWPFEEKGKHAKEDARPTYRVALDDVGLTHYGDANVQIGASCDAFVATVYRYSGADPGIVCCGAANILSYLQQNSDKYEEVPNTPESLKPGDIRASSGHVEIYVEDNGVGRIASASYGERTAEVGNFYDNNGSFKAFRLKGGVK